MKNLNTGPDWIVWIVFAIFVILGVILLSGHGANLISGYNTATKEEKEKYDEKKLCRVIGGGLMAIAVVFPVAILGENVFLEWVVYAIGGYIIVDCIILIILANTICKK